MPLVVDTEGCRLCPVREAGISADNKRLIKRIAGEWCKTHGGTIGENDDDVLGGGDDGQSGESGGTASRAGSEGEKGGKVTGDDQMAITEEPEPE